MAANGQHFVDGGRAPYVKSNSNRTTYVAISALLLINSSIAASETELHAGIDYGKRSQFGAKASAALAEDDARAASRLRRCR